jgi:MtrB/PioB family decaheme-associated outer membrane protein
MQDRSEVLKKRRSILLVGTILIAAVPFSGAFAAEQAAPAAPEWPKWYFYGGLETGDRFFGDRPGSGIGRAPPPANWLTPVTTHSRAKFEEYGQVLPGAFLDWINLQAGTTDGRYAFDFWGRSVGINNQSYTLDASELGRHYLSLGWDQTPHLISSSAKNIFGGVNTSSLTVPDSVRAALQAQLPNANLAAPPAVNGVLGQTARTNIENIINNNLTGLDLSTQRDRASAAYLFTPTPDWDFGVGYSHEHRTGLRPTGVAWGYTCVGQTAATPGCITSTLPQSPRPTNVIEMPQPLNDTTQNVETKGEYVGTTFWGTRWTTNLKYNGSFFDQDVKQIDIENPFCLTCSLFTGLNRGPNALRWAPPPSNNANAITSNTAVDLPFWNSRFVNTFQYNAMRQDDAFVNTGTNGVVMPPVTLAGVPVGSLDGKVDTFLWNGVYTGRPTKDLQLTIRGRHYDIENRTLSLHIDNWIWADSGCAGGQLSATGICPPTNARNALPISYTKDNASGEATWRAARWASVGGGAYWERYDRQLRDVPVTNEVSGKTWVDLDPVEYIHTKASYSYGQRRYNDYNTEEFVEVPGLQFSEPASNLRRFDVANRNRQKAELMLEWTPGRFVTFSPNAGLRWDDYPDDVFNPLGLRKDHSWNAGIEVAAMLDPTFKLMVSYNYENRKLDVAGGSGGANFITGNPFTGCPTAATLNPEAIIGTSCTWGSNIDQRYHTFMVAGDWKVVPSRFDVRLEYLYSRGKEQNTTTPCSAPLIVGGGAVGTNCAGLNTTGPTTGVTLVDPALVNGGQFPAETTTFQRFNVIGRYYVDPTVVQQMGFKGDVTVKVRYTWEKNDVSNWAIDNMTPYVPTADTTELTGANRSLFLAAFNPNYTAQIVAVSTVLKW